MARSSLHSRVHALNFIRTLAVTSALFLFPLHFVRIGFGGWRIGALISILSAAPLLAAFPTGWINDRFSIAGVARAALAAVAAVFLSLIVLRNFYAIAAALFVLGLAGNALDVSINSLYYKDETAMDQNRKYGVFVFWLGFGPVLGIAGGGLLTQAVDFRALFAVFALLMAAAAPLAGRLDGGTFHLVPMRDYGRDFLRPKTLLFIVFVFFLGLHWSVEGTVYAPFLQRRFGLNTLEASLYMAGELLFLPLAALLIGRRRFEPRANRRLIVAAMALSGAGQILTVMPDVFVSLAFRIVHEIGDGVAGALIAVSISRMFEKRSIGGSAGLVLAVEILAKMLGALFFAPLGFQRGLELPFIVSGALLLADAAYGAVIFRRIDY